MFVKVRGGAAKLLIVFIAGKSTDDVAAAAKQLKAMGVVIICIGVGKYDQSQLIAMASSSQYILKVSSFSMLMSFKMQFVQMIQMGK